MSKVERQYSNRAMRKDFESVFFLMKTLNSNLKGEKNHPFMMEFNLAREYFQGSIVIEGKNLFKPKRRNTRYLYLEIKRNQDSKYTLL